MINDNTIKRVIIEQRELLTYSSDYLEREQLNIIDKYIKLPHIIIISGPRRAGKSVFLTQIIEKYYKNTGFYYLNLDDERLISITVDDIDRIIEIFIELYGENKVIFFDEIQNIHKWERFITRLYNYGYKIYITGSNANLLSSELATFLTGRYININIFPFSFSEFLNFKGLHFNKNDIYTTVWTARINNAFEKYLTYGGFPEVVRFDNIDILKNFFSDVIIKDIVQRYKIKEIKTLQEISHFLLSNISNEISFNRIKNIYSIGSVHTAKNYIHYLESSFLFFIISKFSYSLRESQIRTKKCYIIDNGFIESIGFSHTLDKGKLFENLVAVELLRRGNEFYYFKDKSGKEVDFIIKENRKITECIQVCYDINDDKTFKREISALISAMNYFNLKEGIILVNKGHDIINVGNKKVKIILLWEWLLSHISNN